MASSSSGDFEKLKDILNNNSVLSTLGDQDAIKAIAQRFAARERIVRTAPELYFWLHRRWKHQPPSKKAKGEKQAA
jgi:hypothetical protein